MPKHVCPILYYYVEDSNESIFASEYLFAIDTQSNSVFIAYHNKIIDIYIPNMNYIVELGG